MTSPYRWVILAVSTLGFIQSHLHRVGFAPLIPIFIRDLRITYAAAGTLMTSYFWTYMVAQIPIGLLTDRWGARRVMIVFTIILSFGVLGFPLSQSYGQSLLARTLVGLGAAAVWVPAIRLINEWFPPHERGRATGILSAGGGLGGTLGLLAIPLLAELWGWRWGYASMVLPVLLTLALLVLFVRPADRTGDPRHESSGVRPVENLSWVSSLAGLRRVLASYDLWTLNATMLLFYGAYFSLLTWMPAFLAKELGASQSRAGLVTSLMTAGGIVSWPLAGLIADRLGRRKAIFLLSQAASCLVSLTFAWIVPGLPLGGAAAVAVASGIFIGGMITGFLMVVELFPVELAGSATAVMNTCSFVGSLIIPVLLGRIIDLTGSFPAAFATVGAVQALSLAIACFTRETGTGRRRPI